MHQVEQRNWTKLIFLSKSTDKMCLLIGAYRLPIYIQKADSLIPHIHFSSTAYPLFIHRVSTSHPQTYISNLRDCRNFSINCWSWSSLILDFLLFFHIGVAAYLFASLPRLLTSRRLQCVMRSSYLIDILISTASY